MLANDDYDPANGLGTSTSSFSVTYIFITLNVHLHNLQAPDLA
jgi:hypothetical protein